jgi:hypothetical protein
MSVTARFFVDEMTRRAHNPGHAAIVLKPAYRGEENKAWSEATPSGKIELYVSNPAAVDQFDEWMRTGKDLHLTFEPVDRAAPTT